MTKKLYTYADFAYEFDKCWACGQKENPWIWEGGLEIHHIVRGSLRAKGADDPAGWIRTCARCHRDALDAMPAVRQLALKKIHDPKHYNRERINKLRRRAKDAITEEEVDAEVKLIQEEK